VDDHPLRRCHMSSTPVPDEDRAVFADEDEDTDDLRAIPVDADEADVIEQRQLVPEGDDESAPGAGS
jgi:hypothetical protein